MANQNGREGVIEEGTVVGKDDSDEKGPRQKTAGAYIQKRGHPVIGGAEKSFEIGRGERLIYVS